MRNSSLVKRLGADNSRDSNLIPKLRIYSNVSGRGAFHRQRRCSARDAGVDGKEDVGISNDKESEKLSHRKSKVS